MSRRGRVFRVVCSGEVTVTGTGLGKPALGLGGGDGVWGTGGTADPPACCLRGRIRILRQSTTFMMHLSACWGTGQDPVHPPAAFCPAVLSGGSFPSRKGEMVLFGAGQKLRGPLRCSLPLASSELHVSGLDVPEPWQGLLSGTLGCGRSAARGGESRVPGWEGCRVE